MCACCRPYWRGANHGKPCFFTPPGAKCGKQAEALTGAPIAKGARCSSQPHSSTVRASAGIHHSTGAEELVATFFNATTARRATRGLRDDLSRLGYRAWEPPERFNPAAC